MAKDLFSQQASQYAQSRPTYPKEMVEYIVSLCDARHNAWDCATGNGQAAILLADYFDHVEATDLSEAQLKYARPHPKIRYRQCTAEHTPFAPDSFDLVTVAQAYHWFDHEAFCKEVKRVARKNALVAVWGYIGCRTDDERINERLDHFYRVTAEPYWDSRRQFVDEQYKNVRFDFEEIPVNRQFFIHCQWTPDDLRGYLSSWSAVQKFIEVNSFDPVALFIETLSELWKPGVVLPFRFPLFMRLGRVF